MAVQHVYAQHGRQRLRISRQHAASKVRTVEALQPDGTWVQLGQVSGLGGITYLATPAVEGSGVPTIGCTSYVEGARLLADRLQVTASTHYTVSIRTHSEEA